MRGWSFCGCGLMQLGLRWDDEGNLETTRWITLLFVPILPVSRWRVRYAGTAETLGPDDDESFLFEPIERLSLDPSGVLGTALCGWCLFGVAVGPALGCVFGIHGAADKLQMVLVFASCLWPLLVVIWVQRRCQALVQRPPGSWSDAQPRAAADPARHDRCDN